MVRVQALIEVKTCVDCSLGEEILTEKFYICHLSSAVAVGDVYIPRPENYTQGAITGVFEKSKLMYTGVDSCVCMSTKTIKQLLVFTPF